MQGDDKLGWGGGTSLEEVMGMDEDVGEIGWGSLCPRSLSIVLVHCHHTAPTSLVRSK